MNITLIIKAEDGWTGPSENIAGYRWHLSANHRVESATYHCVSYTWGNETVPNLFELDGSISSRTRSALEAAIRSLPPDTVGQQAFWIDAVCVPSEGAARRATLESMGYIYSGAVSTVVVLQSATWDIISRDARSKEPYTESQLDQLNEDRWITSVWTYQELVNARDISFTAVGIPTATTMGDDDFFNSIGFSLARYKKRHNLSSLGIRARYPFVDALEDAMADRRNAAYLDRSMLACLTGISSRYCDPARPTNRMYALLGALTQEPSWGSVDETVSELADKAMRICEAKSDFSYIYTSDRRREGEQKWRPGPQAGLHPILKWYSWGERQPGVIVDGCLKLHEMVRLNMLAEPFPEVLAHTMEWLHDFAGIREEQLNDISDLVKELPRALRSIGFTGSAVCYKCESGFVLTQEEVEPADTVDAYASSGIRWSFGAPGIAQVNRTVNEVDVQYTALIYFGLPLTNRPQCSVLLE